MSTLDRAIQSILWQTFADWELIVVNDGSTDQTSNILKAVNDPRIHVVHGEEGQKGLATRLNQCIELAKGKYIARMDADDISYPERLKRQVQYLEAHPDIDLLGHGAVLFKGDGRIIGVYPTACDHAEICRSPWWGFPLAHPTWMATRSWFAVHRYAESLMKGQDQDLLLRTYRTSRFAALPDVLMGYRMENISLKKSARGRMNYCRRLFQQVEDVPSARGAARGALVHALGFARDLAGKFVGRRFQLSENHRVPIDPQIIQRWNEIWNNDQAMRSGQVIPM
jgi:glycosyltransferase involved in cell wall biosynthesis